MDVTKEMTKIEVEAHALKESGNIPNNPDLPLLVYRNVLQFGEKDPASVVEDLFREEWLEQFVARWYLRVSSLSQQYP